MTCRGRVAERYGLTPRKNKPWQYEGGCPLCHHGGFSLSAGNQGPNPPRHVWWCNCHRCGCDPAAIRQVMLKDGISEDCLGTYKKRSAPPAKPTDPAEILREAMRKVLADTKIRALADMKIRMLEVIDGEAAPEDWDGFVAFASRAGVSRSKRYEAAERWGRSATAVDTPEAASVSSGTSTEAKSAVPKRDTQEVESSRFGKTDSPVSGQRTKRDKPIKPAA